MLMKLSEEKPVRLQNQINKDNLNNNQEYEGFK